MFLVVSLGPSVKLWAKRIGTSVLTFMLCCLQVGGEVDKLCETKCAHLAFVSGSASCALVEFAPRLERYWSWQSVARACCGGATLC